MKNALSLRRNRAAFRRLLRRLRYDRKGVAAVEFAFILMPMIILYFGVAETAQGVMIDRKVSQLTRSLADMTALGPTVSDADLDNTFLAGAMIMEPYHATTKMVITSVVIDNAGRAKVCWSDANANGTPLARDSDVTLPAALRVANSSVIMATASYDFKLFSHFIIENNKTLSIPIGGAPIYMRPRTGRPGSTGIEQIALVNPTNTRVCP